MKNIVIPATLLIAISVAILPSAAFAAYEFYVNNATQHSFVRQAFNVQDQIIHHVTGGALLPFAIFLIIVCLFMWAKRISEEDSVTQFLVWFVIAVVLVHITFMSKTNIQMHLYDWNAAEAWKQARGVHADHQHVITDKREKVSGVSGINAFFAQATKIMVITARAAMDRSGVRAKSLEVCVHPLAWYYNAYTAVLAKIGPFKGRSDTGAEAVRAFHEESVSMLGAGVKEDELGLLAKIASWKPFSGSSQKGTKDDVDRDRRQHAWAHLHSRDTFQSVEKEKDKQNRRALFEENVKKYASKCRAELGGQKGEQKVFMLQAANTVYQNPLVNVHATEFGKLLSEQKSMPTIHEIARDVGLGNVVSVVTNWATGVLFNLWASVMPSVHPRMQFLLVIKGIITSILLVAAPFVVMFSLVPTSKHAYGVNFKMLLLFLLSFLFVQLWYPVIMFVQALLYRQLLF